MDSNGAIGINNQLPWKLSSDLKYFKKITLGKSIIMGRKTHESIGRPLPGRQNIIISRDKSYSALGCLVFNSVQEALQSLERDNEVMIIGGSSMYRELLPSADKIYLTLIDHTFEADTFFPELNPSQWQQVSKQSITDDPLVAYTYHFIILQRVTNPSRPLNLLTNS